MAVAAESEPVEEPVELPEPPVAEPEPEGEAAAPVSEVSFSLTTVPARVALAIAGKGTVPLSG